MVVRVTEPGRPAFQLRKGEEGLSVFDPEAVQPPLTESEILDAFRPGSILVFRDTTDIEAKSLEVVPIQGVESLPSRLRELMPRSAPGQAWLGPNSSGHCESWNNMNLRNPPSLEISSDLIDAIRSFPVRRQIEHCGTLLTADAFDFYIECPQCGNRIKVRSYAATPEIEDLFDAVFEWMNQNDAEGVATRRRSALAADE